MPPVSLPRNAVLITALPPRDADAAALVNPRRMRCAACRCAVLVCSISLENAEFLAAGRRPVAALCVACRNAHDLSALTHTLTTED